MLFGGLRGAGTSDSAQFINVLATLVLHSAQCLASVLFIGVDDVEAQPNQSSHLRGWLAGPNEMSTANRRLCTALANDCATHEQHHTRQTSSFVGLLERACAGRHTVLASALPAPLINIFRVSSRHSQTRAVQ